jgi:hypothetical protein
MDYFLKFLIHNLQTIDGKRGSAKKVLELMDRESIEEYKKKHNKTDVSESVRLKLQSTNRHIVFRKVYMKYLIMRIRSKISFIALVRRMTIVELIASTI